MHMVKIEVPTHCSIANIYSFFKVSDADEGIYILSVLIHYFLLVRVYFKKVFRNIRRIT